MKEKLISKRLVRKTRMKKEIFFSFSRGEEIYINILPVSFLLVFIFTKFHSEGKFWILKTPPDSNKIPFFFLKKEKLFIITLYYKNNKIPLFLIKRKERNQQSKELPPPKLLNPKNLYNPWLSLTKVGSLLTSFTKIITSSFHITVHSHSFVH